jgi:hypothetical protein
LIQRRREFENPPALFVPLFSNRILRTKKYAAQRKELLSDETLSQVLRKRRGNFRRINTVSVLSGILLRYMTRRCSGAVFSDLTLLVASASVIVSAILFAPRSAHAQSPENWQQRVDYEMDITLLADTHQLRGSQRLTYTNNSPDTLETAYYHLYFNAFHPNSMMAERNRHLPDPDGRIVPRIFNLGPDTRGYHRILSLQQDGRSVDFTVRETVVRVNLAEPIPPGTSTTFEMEFESQVPKQVDE